MLAPNHRRVPLAPPVRIRAPPHPQHSSPSPPQLAAPARHATRAVGVVSDAECTHANSRKAASVNSRGCKPPEPISLRAKAPTAAFREKPGRRFDEYRDSALWRAVEEIVNELGATREILINTAPEYVIGYFCRELSARGMASPRAGTPRS